jgi:hypothetical protein
MSFNSPSQTEEEQIDFKQISNKIGNFFQGINRAIFNLIQFVLKKKIVLIILLFLGFGFGMFLDQINQTFKSELIVAPNFESSDYLYSKIDLIQSKIKEGDTVFLKSIGIQEPSKIKKITIEPIVDIYGFINDEDRKQNLELLKLMAEDGELKSIIKETTTSKNYTFQTINLITEGATETKKAIGPILNYLNNSTYYKNIQKISVNNIQQKLSASEETVAQINGILNEFSKASSANNQKSDKLVYYNENTQLNDLIRSKELLVKEIGLLKIKLLTSDKIIKESTITLNLENKKLLNNRLKFILPFVLIFGFVIIVFFGRFYKNQKKESIANI